MGMATNPVNAVNRGDCIGDNLRFLQVLNDECIGLIRIAPSFGKSETFGRRRESDPDPLDPPLANEGQQSELAVMRRWGIRDEAEGNALQMHYEGTIETASDVEWVKATLRRTTATRRRSSWTAARSEATPSRRRADHSGGQFPRPASR